MPTLGERLQSYAESRLRPEAWLRASAGVLVAFLLAHAAGLREYMTILSGTPPPGHDLTYGTGVLGALYLVSYMFTVVLAPVLVLAAGFAWLLPGRWRYFDRTSNPNGAPRGTGTP